jgi:NAD(P)-dependent dehydrogenase (short-subunit alcohol dehydrogenase family)
MREVPMTLKGKHVLVTGSSRGIGSGIALKLAERGVRVAVHYYQNEDAARCAVVSTLETTNE